MNGDTDEDENEEKSYLITVLTRRVGKKMSLKNAKRKDKDSDSESDSSDDDDDDDDEGGNDMKEVEKREYVVWVLNH